MGRSPAIPPELAAEMTPAVRAFVDLLLLQIAQRDALIAEQRKQIAAGVPLPRGQREAGGKATRQSPSAHQRDHSRHSQLCQTSSTALSLPAGQRHA